MLDGTTTKCYDSIGKDVKQVVNNTIMVHAGRQFLPEEIELIQWTRKTYKDLKRKEFAETVCEFLNWKTNSGKLKTTLCLGFLEELEQNSIIKLPPAPKPSIRKGLGKKKIYDATHIVRDEIVGNAGEFEAITIELVQAGTEEMKRWRYYVEEYHMLGDKTAFGDRLFYLIKSGERDLGCMQFSAAAWALESRDQWIGWDSEIRKKHLFLIVNNSRYLILPWVKIKYLASKVLSLISKQIRNDWRERYCYEPVLLETFVDLEHFQGTCYKAANWIRVGETKGRGRMDRFSKNELSRKAIFMYPLEKDFKRYLRGEKPYKRVSEDERWW